MESKGQVNSNNATELHVTLYWDGKRLPLIERNSPLRGHKRGLCLAPLESQKAPKRDDVRLDCADM